MKMLVTFLMYGIAVYVLASGLWFEITWHLQPKEKRKGFFEPGGPLNGHVLSITGVSFIVLIPWMIRVLF